MPNVSAWAAQVPRDYWAAVAGKLVEKDLGKFLVPAEVAKHGQR